MKRDFRLNDRASSRDASGRLFDLIYGPFSQSGGKPDWRSLACARLSDSIRRARLGKGGGGGGKNAALSLSSPRAFFAFLITERLSTTISEPGTG